MIIKNGILYGLPLLLAGGMALVSYNNGKNPVYVQDAIAAVSNKMSYSYGLSTCKASEKDVSHWEMECNSSTMPLNITFTVQPAEKSPYRVATSFYLTAKNEAAKKASKEDLLEYLLINNT